MSTKTRKLLPAAVVIAAAALATVPALAAPDRTTTLNREAVEYKWEGGPGNGIPEAGRAGCDNPASTCDDTLLKLEVGGDLEVKITEVDDTTADLDLYLFKANAAGDPEGTAIAQQADETATEKVKKAGLAEGNYLVRVRYYAAVEGVFKATATLSPVPAPPASTPEPTPTVAATPPRPTPTATPTPAPDHVVLPPPARSSSKKSTKRKQTARQKCLKKAKKIKNAKKRKAARKKCTAKKKKRS